MPAAVQLEVLDQDRPAYRAGAALPLVLGRQDERGGDPAPPALRPAEGGRPARLVLGRPDEKDLSRHHARVEDGGAGHCTVTNTFDSADLGVADRPPIAPLGAARLELPFTLCLPEGKRVRFTAAAPAAAPAGPVTIGDLRAGPVRVEDLRGWLRETLRALQRTVDSHDFTRAAAEALVSVGRFDSGRVLAFGPGGAARVLTAHPPRLPTTDDWRPSSRLVERLLATRQTCWHNGADPLAPGPESSLAMVTTAVAAPLLGPDGQVAGALYGERRFRPDEPAPPPVGEAEALLVDILACGVAAGMNRVRHEQEAVSKQAMLEAYFGERLAALLASRPALLREGREADVTLLFCDVRHFSSISEALTAPATVGWLHDVMTRLSRCVLDEDGVVVDYAGDGLLAMWGAPAEQDDHARRAARAALAMLDALDGLRADYRGRLGRDRSGNDLDMDLGVGLNSGRVFVGNTGSDQKFKYGPLGAPVNLASRVEGLTKYLKCRLLVTGPTWARLRDDPAFLARRACKVRVVNIHEPVDVYAVERDAPGRRELARRTELALAHLEQARFPDAAWEAGDLLRQHPGDGPCRLILWRATEMLVKEGKGFDPVWEPPGK